MSEQNPIPETQKSNRYHELIVAAFELFNQGDYMSALSIAKYALEIAIGDEIDDAIKLVALYYSALSAEDKSLLLGSKEWQNFSRSDSSIGLAIQEIEQRLGDI